MGSYKVNIKLYLQNLPPNPDSIRVWEVLSLQIRKLTLDKISEYMLLNKEFFKVPSTIFDDNEQLLLYEMISNEVIFKDEEIIKTGMLKKKGIVISFTFDEFRDFCLTEYIMKTYEDEPQFKRFWEKMQSEDYTIREGVSKYIFYLARTMSQDELLPVIKGLPEYGSLYWAHIWGLEDRWFNMEDAAIWKQELMQNEKHSKRIVRDLIRKYDCDYFENINIKMLFEVLDEISANNGVYLRFIRKMFEPYYESRYGYAERMEAACPFNWLLSDLNDGVENNEWNKIHASLYKLTIYLMDLENWDTKDLWEKFYQTSPEVAIDILNEMNNYETEFINGNVKEILNYLSNINKEPDDFTNEVKKLYCENTFCQEIDISLDEIFKLLNGE